MTWRDLRSALSFAGCVVVCLVVGACSSSASDGTPSSSAGHAATSAAGSASSGGVAASGGASGSIAAVSNGGAVSSGGALNTGGVFSSGGAPLSGGGAPSSGAGSGAAIAGSGGVGAGVGGASTTAGSGGSGPIEPFKGVANSPCAARSALHVSWYYNWTQKESEPCVNGAGGEFVPMIWGHAGAEQTAASIQSAVAGFVTKGFRSVLGFNEPDNATQSNIASATAISLLPSFDNAAIQVGTPATQANVTGQAWFKDYMAKLAASTSLRGDFMALHWYGWNAGSCNASASELESYLKYAEGLPGNRPIWLTEWACLNLSAPTPEGVLAFYQGALAVFAKHPRLRRYAWYPWTANCELTKSDGSLTPLGVEYAAAPARK